MTTTHNGNGSIEDPPWRSREEPDDDDYHGAIFSVAHRARDVPHNDGRLGSPAAQRRRPGALLPLHRPLPPLPPRPLARLQPLTGH